MIIELTGIPGAGKSTILKHLSVKTVDPNVVFNVESYILKNSYFSIKGKFYFELLVFANLLKLKKEDRILIRKSISLIQKSKNTLFHKVNIIRNIVKKLIIYRYIQERDEIFFIDEGVSHIPFNLFVDVKQKINVEELENFFYLLPRADRILVVDASDEILLQRVIERGKEGHRRINFNSQEEVIRFMDYSRHVLEKIKAYYKVSSFTNEVKKIDENKIYKMVGLK